MKDTKDSETTINAADCDEEFYGPIIGSDGHCYLNECRAIKQNISIKESSYNKKYYKKNNSSTWPIELVCKPHQESWDTIPAIDLNDGTFIYTNKELIKFRGTRNTCRCLPGETLIATPSGNISISNLLEGDSVYTTNIHGDKIATTIRRINKESVPSDYTVIRIQLKDGRQWTSSAGHPMSEQLTTTGQLKLGDPVDGSYVASIDKIGYNAAYTYDILPYGETGNYWANGILIGSTMRYYYYYEDLLRMGW